VAQQTFIGNLRQSPVWLKDFANREHLQLFPAKLDPAQFTDQAGVTVTTTAIAAQSATSVAVTALTPSSTLANTTLIAAGNVLIPSGTVLYFGGAKVATLTADAKIGDTALTVAALPTALASGDVATYSVFNGEFIPSGTFVGRTYAESQAFTAFGPAATSDDELFLTAFDTVNARYNGDIELVRHNSVVAENLLPGYGASGVLGTSGSPSALLTKLRTLYRCIQAAQ
jgi:hypothetical protein